MKILTAAEMREVDKLTMERYAVPSLALMDSAGKSVAQFIQQRFPNLATRRIVVLCGKGNNGGDGFVAARHLREMGAKPVVFLFAAPEEMRGDAAANAKRWRDTSADIHIVRHSLHSDAESIAAASFRGALVSADVIVDALLGTGARVPVEGLLGSVIEEINQHPYRASIIAVDIPSGLSADSGDPQGPVVEADSTITFTAPKVGMFLGEAGKFVGQLYVRDIGSPAGLIESTGKGNLRWIDAEEVASFALPRRAEGNKGDYGHALVVAGSAGKSGAAVLASWAALRAGAGLVTVATPEPALPIIAAHTPEVMTEPLPATPAGSISIRSLENNRFESLLKGKRALAIGPGLTTQEETQQFVRAVVANRAVPIVLDADGLNAFAGRAAELRKPDGMLIVTPHPGEMSRLLGCSTQDVQANRVELARKAAMGWNACVVLKGHHTVIASPEGSAYVNSTGNPGMGTGGTGDVLTGMLAGLVAQYGKNPSPKRLAEIANFGVYLHGLAGDLAYKANGEAPLIASDLIEFIPRAYHHFYSELGRA